MAMSAKDAGWESVPQQRRRGAIELRFDHGKILVTPEDYNKFVIEARRAVEALKNASDVDSWVERLFSDYIPRLHHWCEERSTQINSCFIVFRNVLQVFVVATGMYNTDLGAEIAQLELTLHDAGWPSDVIQLPCGDDDELRIFFNPDQSVQVYGQTEATSGKS